MSYLSSHLKLLTDHECFKKVIETRYKRVLTYKYKDASNVYYLIIKKGECGKVHKDSLLGARPYDEFPEWFEELYEQAVQALREKDKLRTTLKAQGYALSER